MANDFQTLFAGQDVVEQVINDFQDAWRRNEPPSLTVFLKRIQDQSQDIREALRIRLIQLDQAVRWQLWRKQADAMAQTANGASSSTERPIPRRAPLLEDYARSCPDIGPLDSLPLELIVHEFQLRTECRDNPQLEEYQQRFPQFASELPTAVMTALVESDTAVTGPDGMTLIEPAHLKGTGTRRPSGETTMPMQPSELPRRRRATDRLAPSGQQFGQYELLHEIARGAMGVVYKARHVAIDKPVALKMILAGQLASSQEIRLFQQEAKNAGQLEHENIVRIYDAGEIDGQHFIAMAFIEGQSLSDMVREKPLPPRRAAEIVELVARALHYAHTQTQPVFHRDIKPANILMDSSGKPFVTDFGIAKRVEGEDSKATRVGVILGTPSYMPPEQAKGLTTEIGSWSDVYSTGAVLYHLLTGKPPFIADTVMETLRQVLQEDAVSPRELNHQVNADLEAVCLKCLEKDRNKRYQTALELADDLHRYLTHAPTKARPLSSLGRAARWCRRNPAIAGLTIVTASLLVLVAVVAVLGYVRERNAKGEALAAKLDALNKKAEAVEAKKKADDEAERARKAEIQAKSALILAQEAEKKAVAEKTKADAAAMTARSAEEKAKEALAAETNAKMKADASAKEAMQSAMIANEEKRKADLARDEAQKSLQHAISTVNQLLTNSADEGLKDLPGGEAIRNELAQEALRQLKPLIEVNPTDRKARLAVAKVKRVQARLLAITEPGSKVDAVFQEAINRFQELFDEDPNQSDVLVELVATLRDFGDSLTDRSDRETQEAANGLLRNALQQYASAIELSSKVQSSNPNLKFEVARTYHSRSISYSYLGKVDSALEDEQQASTMFDELSRILEEPESKRKVQRLLANSLRTVVHTEFRKNSQAVATVVQGWLAQLSRAKGVHSELLRANPTSVELRNDLALTSLEIAFILSKFADRLDEALEEVARAQETFDNLARRFEENPEHEKHRIWAIWTSGSLHAKKGNFTKAAQELEAAENAIRKYNSNSTGKREDIRFEIAKTAMMISDDLHRRNDRTNASKTITWVLTAIRELTRASDPSVAQGANDLLPQAETLDKKIKTTTGSSK